MNDRFYINIIIRRIEKKLGWKKVSLWTDNEFKKLGLLIYEKTAISISPQTLKRLFGKVKYKEVYHAQPATKDALARLIDYTDWDAFVQDQHFNTYKYISLIRKNISGRLNKKSITLIIISMIVAVAAIFVFRASKNNKISFYAENVTGMAPHTVSFHLNVSNLKTKDLFIDFDQNEAEDPSKGELIDKNLKLINHCFESPGYFNVKLLSKGKVLASTKIHVLSEGWNSYYFNNDNFRLRKFVFELQNRVQKIEKNGILYISPADLNKKGFNGNTVYYLEHLMYRDFHVSADNSAFEAGYKNNSEIGGISCYDVEFRIIGETGLISVILVQKGCYRWSEITVGEQHLNGKYNDLSFLSADLSDWNQIKILLKNNKAVFVNNSDTIFRTNYDQLIGQVKGIRFVTKGSGAFDYVRLFNERGELMFDDNFDN
jgi:hypothetical protein